MERCTLCGGKLADGRCTECGLDNRKNDKKYRLNVHNEKEMRFHDGTCGAHLNKKNDAPSDRTEMPDSFGEVYSANKKKVTKKQKARRETGTVKKKSKLARLLAVLVFFGVAGELIGTFLPIVIEEAESVVSGWKESGPEEDFGADSVKTDLLKTDREGQRPEAVDWKTQDGDYYEKELTYGIYTAGYEIPAGRYQFFCEEGTAWVDWWDEDGNSDWICLYSKQAQEEYGEFWEEESYYELSKEIELSENTVVYVGDCEKSVWIRGVASGDTAARKPQGLEELILKDGMTAGADFESGIYDLVLDEDPDGEYRSVSIRVGAEDGSEISVYLDTEKKEFCHMPLTEGSAVYLETYDDTKTEDLAVRIVPSW